MTPTENPTPEESEEFARALKPPYYAIADWRRLGRAIASRRAELDPTPSVQLIGERSGIEAQHLAALEDGSISLAETALVDLPALETVLGWDVGASKKILAGEWHPPLPNMGSLDEARPSYSQADWKRLGKAVQEARIAQKMTRSTLGYAIRSSSKTIKRLEEGEIYSDPKTAPPGDYNSERYMRKRLSLLETALEWEVGSAVSILNGPDRQSDQIS